MTRILFLYTEVAGYFLSSLEELLKRDTEILVVKWPVNTEAPFEFDPGSRIKMAERKSLTDLKLHTLVAEFRPDIIYCSGWIDKGYLDVCKKYTGRIPVIVGLDNHWKGTIKQHLAALVSGFSIRKIFSHVWIPGEPQREYARKLGFERDSTLEGFYTADTTRFLDLGKKYLQAKAMSFPKKFIFVGRYFDFKGVTDLWEAFSSFKERTGSEWELWCLGTGNIRPVSTTGISHFGFVQPDRMDRFIRETGVFVLPSRFEPWGVVVHEFAAAGFPLILSDEVGAGSAFLEDGNNGMKFKAGDVSELESCLKKMSKFSDEKLARMGQLSMEAASYITPETWSDTLLSVLD